jgi:hypothetical protein
MDNRTGHYTGAFVLWFCAHGIRPLYTPLSGSWVTTAESVQRILKRRPLDVQHPQTAQEIIAWLEAAARSWNREPTPFLWGGQAHSTARASTRATPYSRRIKVLAG